MDSTRTAVSGQFFLTEDLDTTPEIDVSLYASGQISIPSDSLVDTLSYYSLPESGGTPLAMYDSGNNLITQTVTAGRTIDLKSIASVRILKLVVSSADPNPADGNVTLSFKS